MTVDRFQGWFEGFCIGIGDAPTPEQWQRLVVKVATLNAAPVQYSGEVITNGIVPLKAIYCGGSGTPATAPLKSVYRIGDDIIGARA